MAIQLPRLQGPISAYSRTVEVHGVHPQAEVTIRDLNGGGVVTSANVPAGGVARIDLPQGTALDDMLLVASQRVGNVDSGVHEAAAISVRGRVATLDEVRRAEVPQPPHRCGRTMIVNGVVPGVPVVVRDVASATESRAVPVLGSVRVDFDTPAGDLGLEVFQDFDQLGPGPKTFVEVLEIPSDPPVPPVVAAMVNCQTTVPVGEVLVGATVDVEIVDKETGVEVLREYTSPSSRFEGRLADPLKEGQSVRARHRFPDCDLRGEFGEPVSVSGAVPQPYIEWPLCPTSNPQDVTVQNVVHGATLTLDVGNERYSEIEVTSEDGVQLVCVSELPEGEIVTAVQTLCGTDSARSNRAQIRISRGYAAEEIVGPVYECASAVQVENLPTPSVIRLEAHFPDGSTAVVTEDVAATQAKMWVNILPLYEGAELALVILNCGKRREADRALVERAPFRRQPTFESAEENETVVTVLETLQAALVRVYRIDGNRTVLIGSARGTDRRTSVALQERLQLNDELIAKHVFCDETAEFATSPVTTVTVQRPYRPVLENPADGSPNVDPLNTVFRWSDPGAGSGREATKFDVFIETAGRPAVAKRNEQPPLLGVELDPSLRYEWIVRSSNAGGDAEASATFHTGINSQPDSFFTVVVQDDASASVVLPIDFRNAQWKIGPSQIFRMNGFVTVEATETLGLVFIEAEMSVIVRYNDQQLVPRRVWGGAPHTIGDGTPISVEAVMRWVLEDTDQLLKRMIPYFDVTVRSQ